MLSKKILSASQTSATASEEAQASGTGVSNTLLPSTVVCYTNGVSGTNAATSIQGYYRAASGNLYSSTSLFTSQGTSSQFWGVARTYNIATGTYGAAINSGYFTSMGYDSSDYPLVSYSYYNPYDAHWQCTWVRDYLPDHLDSNTDSLCIEAFVLPYNSYFDYSPIMAAGAWGVDSPAGLYLNYYNGSDTSGRSSIFWGDGSGDRDESGSITFGTRSWNHVSWLWDFENSRAAFHHNGTEELSTTDSDLATGATWTTKAASGVHSRHYDALLLGHNGHDTTTFASENYYMEVIVSVDDSTKQARYGSSFTPSTTPLIAGGS